MEDPFEGEGSADGGGDLSCDVGGHLGPREVTEDRKGDRERGVEVSPRYVACGEDDYHDG